MSIDVARAFCEVLGSGWSAGAPGRPRPPHFSMPLPYLPFVSVLPHSLRSLHFLASLAALLACCLIRSPQSTPTGCLARHLPAASSRPPHFPLAHTPVHQPFVAAPARSSMCVRVTLVHVLGTPCEIAVGYDAGWWWVWVRDWEAMGGQRVRQREAWEGRDLTKVLKPSI